MLLLRQPESLAAAVVAAVALASLHRQSLFESELLRTASHHRPLPYNSYATTLMNPVDQQAVRAACKEAAVRLAQDVVSAVNQLPLEQRTAFGPSLLKPAPGLAAVPDVAGEQVALQHLDRLSAELQLPVHLVIDAAGSYWRVTPAAAAAAAAGHDAAASGGQLCCSTTTRTDDDAAHAAPAAAGGREGPYQQQQQRQLEEEQQQQCAIWCYLDAVDGTLKLSGLFNQPASNGQPARLRVVNDGSWAVGVALTDAVSTPLQELRLADFTTAVIMDGQPAAAGAGSAVAFSHPPVAVASLEAGADAATGSASSTTTSAAGSAATVAGSGGYVTRQGASGACPRLHTTTCAALPQCFAIMDCFQAHDTRSAAPGDAQLAARLHQLLQARNEGGAFDVLRCYGNLGSLLRSFFSRRCDGAGAGDDDGGSVWCEPQCGAFVVVNENLANLIPAVPVVLGAGGVATDFQGQPLLQRRLGQGRVSVVFAANAKLHAAVMRLVADAARC